MFDLTSCDAFIIFFGHSKCIQYQVPFEDIEIVPNVVVANY